MELLRSQDNKPSNYEFQMKKLAREKETLEGLIQQRNREIKTIE